MRLDRPADCFGDEAHFFAGLVKRPCEIHVLGKGSRSPSSLREERRRAIDAEAAGGDERLLVVLLDLLVEGERKEILDISPTLPDGAHISRNDEAAGCANLRPVEGG